MLSKYSVSPYRIHAFSISPVIHQTPMGLPSLSVQTSYTKLGSVDCKFLKYCNTTQVSPLFCIVESNMLLARLVASSEPSLMPLSPSSPPNLDILPPALMMARLISPDKYAFLAPLRKFATSLSVICRSSGTN